MRKGKTEKKTEKEVGIFGIIEEEEDEEEESYQSYGEEMGSVDDVPQAFSHASFTMTNNMNLVCDLQVTFLHT